MSSKSQRIAFALCSIAALAASGCGGSGGSDSGTTTPPTPTTSNVDVTVIDGAIKNALVCLDANSNGSCDAGETQGRTDASGKVTLTVPTADVGKYAVVAQVGTDAVDADTGAVKVAFTLSAPADQTGVVSPFTTLVQRFVTDHHLKTADAAKLIQSATGITVSPFTDFTKVAAPTDGSIDLATLARLLVLTIQQQSTVIASAVGKTAVDNSVITKADVEQAIQQKLLDLLPELIVILGSPDILAASQANKDAALSTAATNLVAASGLTAAALPTVVAINNQVASGKQSTSATPSETVTLASLDFTNASNYSVRTFTGSVAQNTPNASNNIRYVERRALSSAGVVAKWGYGSSPTRGSDIHWSGSAWTHCPINFENSNTVRDANGRNSYNYCDSAETGTASRATFDVSGKTMKSVVEQAIAAGYTNVRIADTSVLGSTTFPTGSSLSYQAGAALTTAISYYPSGSESPVGVSNIVGKYSASISAGGIAASQAAGTACNAPETFTSGSANVATLEEMVTSRPGQPCVFGQGSVTVSGVTYHSDPTNEWWGNSTISIGRIGTATTGSGVPATSYYSTNTLIRIAFTGTGTRPVTYYACKERVTDGSPRNCKPIGTGSYEISKLGDARIMTLPGAPTQAGSLNYTRVFVERGGFIYYGYQSTPAVSNSVRMNTVATNALLGQIGVPSENPSVPLALTAASYQGTWDLRPSTIAPSITDGVRLFIPSGNAPLGYAWCQSGTEVVYSACAMEITDPATGAFSLSSQVATLTGHLDFLTGTAGGSYSSLPGDPTPTSGNFLGGRR